MSTHDRQTTPPRDPEKFQAHLEVQQSTRPNKGSSASGKLLEKVQKEAIKLGVTIDMDQRKYCDPEDMIRFLLALCCQDDSSTTSVSRDETLDRRFEDCLRKVIPVANSEELRQMLDAYKESSSHKEEDMYPPLSKALNYALEDLSNIQVNGLPEFKTHIAFVPCNKGVQSDRKLSGSSFKPDIALVSVQDASEPHEFDQPNTPKVSRLIDEITAEIPSSSARWKTLLSVVEVKRKKGVSSWAPLGVFGQQDGRVGTTRDVDQWLDEKPDDSPPATAVSSTTLVSSKRSASAAGMKTSAEASGNKRQRMQKGPAKTTTQTLAVQNGMYAAERLSDSFVISHVLNLLITNHCLWISWIDREGAIFSSGFSFFEKLPLMLVLLLVLQRFGRRQWGWISELTAEDHSVLLHPINANGTLGENKVGINFHPEDKVHSSWTLLGRATNVVGASRKGEGYNATTKGEHTEVHREVRDDAAGTASRKDSEDIHRAQGGEVGSVGDNDVAGTGTTEIDPGYTADGEADEELREELDPYSQAREEYQKARDKTIKAHNLVLKVSWPETSRSEEWKVIRHAQTLGKDDKFIKGHIPEVKYARDLGRYSTHYIRNFLGIQPEGCPGTRTLRLIVMNRLRPIYDLDGEPFWKVFWQCVACHYRLWVNGIHHGDISCNNLMYDISEADEPVGVVNDFDLAAWVDHKTTNNDRTGTIPFMAIDLLDGGLDDRIPRLYRHDMESFVWVLTYITVAKKQYEDRAIKISPLKKVGTWFKDGNHSDRDAHITTKRYLHLSYGYSQRVTGGYYRYRSVVQRMIWYWGDFHQTLENIKYAPQPLHLNDSDGEEPAPGGLEVDDPRGSLELFVTKVEKSLGEGGIGEGFVEVKTLLLEAIRLSGHPV